MDRDGCASGACRRPTSLDELVEHANAGKRLLGLRILGADFHAIALLDRQRDFQGIDRIQPPPAVTLIEQRGAGCEFVGVSPFQVEGLDQQIGQFTFRRCELRCVGHLSPFLLSIRRWFPTGVGRRRAGGTPSTAAVSSSGCHDSASMPPVGACAAFLYTIATAKTPAFSRLSLRLLPMIPNSPPLRLLLSQTPPPPTAHLLVRFQFAGPAVDDPRVHSLPLSPLSAIAGCEDWYAAGVVESGEVSGVHCTTDGRVLCGAVQIRAVGDAELAATAAQVYRRLEHVRTQLGYPAVLRYWNFLGSINRGEGDAERYRQFSLGRHAALAGREDFDAHLPAATAIGTPGEDLAVYFLAARDAGEPVENPRQISAYRYPRQHGPRSPSFARATLKRWSGLAQLFVSGTASIVGHQSRHPHDAAAQLEETLANIEAVRAAAQARLGAAGPLVPAGVRVYVRRADDLRQVEQRLHAALAPAPLVLLVGDICRRELVLEIEGLYQADCPEPR